MPEPLFAAFHSSYAFVENSCYEADANFPSVFEAVRDGLCRAVDANGHSIDLRIDDSLPERVNGESHEAQIQAVDDWLFRLKVDCHPDRSGFKWKQAVVFGRGLQTNARHLLNEIGYR